MTEVNPEDKRLLLWLQEFHKYLGFRYHGKPFSGSVVQQIEQDVEQIKDAFKKRYGLDFPPLAPFILPTSQIIVFYRKDLTDDEIRSKILFLLRDMATAKKPVSIHELAMAISFVWPNYKPPIEEMVDVTKAQLLN